VTKEKDGRIGALYVPEVEPQVAASRAKYVYICITKFVT